jgi:hypothetical protein
MEVVWFVIGGFIVTVVKSVIILANEASKSIKGEKILDQLSDY